MSRYGNRAEDSFYEGLQEQFDWAKRNGLSSNDILKILFDVLLWYEESY